MDTTVGTRAGSTTGLDPEFVEQWTRRFAEAWNRLDPDLIVPIIAEEVEWHDPVVPHVMRNHEDARGFIRATAEAFSDYRLEWRGPPLISPTEPAAVMRWRMTGKMTGTWSYTGLLPTGQSFEIFGADEFTFRGELMARCRSYFDRFEMARQLGAVPPVGSRGERVMTRLQNLRTRVKSRGG
jgi:hypothetical protein